MFVCPDCLEKKYEPIQDLWMRLRSKGPCESCGLYSVCYDIHHSALEIKKKTKTKRRKK